jgi:5-oxoprolinase (ATP-hydrolysing)
MDDGTPIELRLTIDREERSAIFDFTGTGPEVLGNTNTPRSITRSAILYCLRSMIGKDMPLNSGCLVPITIIIPDHTILSPSPEAAVVGGNVETSQKLVDLILKPFECVSCSQGTMNNFLFGSSSQCYY